MFVSRRVAAILVVALGAAGFVGCGSDEPSDSEPNTGEPGVGVDPLDIFFKTLNTAYIEGSSRKFQVPAVVNGVKAEKWEVTPEGAVDFDTSGVENGVMITPRKAGKFTITAIAGKRKGSVPLNVTAATEEDYARGEARYNNAIMLMFQPGQIMTGAAGGMFMLDNNVSCKNCHGSGAMFLAVEHTPQQTGGYTDDEIKNIFENGMKPAGAKWGSLPGIMNYYPLFHKWAASEEEYQGLVVYLRSLEPKSQGALDFQGLVNSFRMNMGGATGAAGAGTTPPAAGGTAGAAP